MKKEYILKFKSFSDIGSFVRTLSKRIPCDVNASYENQIVDAKSYLGWVSLSSHPITVKINTDDEYLIEKFGEICEKYLYKED